MYLSKYFPGGARGTILITTRNRDFEKYATVRSSELECIDISDAASLLLKACKSESSEEDTPKALAEQIADKLGCLPLGVVHAAALIRQRVCGLEDYIELFSKHRLRLLSNSSDRPPRHESNLYATWNVSWEAIQRGENTISTIALEMLNIFACFHFGEVSVQIFSSGPKRNHSRDHQCLSEVWFEDMLGRLRLYDGASWEPLQFREAISLLCAFSLVAYDKDESRLSLHPLVHAWARDRLGKADFAEWSTKSLVLLTRSMSTTERSYRAERQLLTHMDACSRNSGDLGSLDDDDLKTRLAAEIACVRLYQSHGQIHEAHDLAFRAVKLSVTRWKFSNISSLCSMRVLADQFQAMGEIERALQTYQNITEYVPKMPDQVFPEEISDLELLEQEALCHYARDRFDKAVKCQEIVVKEKIESKTKENRETVASMAYLVKYYRDTGRDKECVILGEEVLPLSKKFRGEHNDGTLLSAEGLAQDYKKLGKPSKGVDLLEWASTACIAPDAPKTSENLKILHTLVLDFYNFGQKDKAKDLAAILASSSVEVLGEDHPQTRKRFEMIKCCNIWAQVHAEAAENDKPITSELLDEIAAMSSDFLQPHDQKVDEKNQQTIERFRKDLENWKPDRQDNAFVRKRIMDWISCQESKFTLPEIFAELPPQMESTVHVLEEKPRKEEIREALGPEVYAEIERYMLADIQENEDTDPEHNDEDDWKVWLARGKIAK